MYNYTAKCGKDKNMAILCEKNKIRNRLWRKILWIEWESWKIQSIWNSAIIRMGDRSAYLSKKFRIQKTLNNY